MIWVCIVAAALSCNLVWSGSARCEFITGVSASQRSYLEYREPTQPRLMLASTFVTVCDFVLERTTDMLANRAALK